MKAEQVDVMPFPALQSAFDGFVPKGMQHYWKADFITELTDEAIAAHVEHGKKTPHISSSMHLHPINGAAQRVGADETAFGHRDKNFAPVIVGIWPDPADNEANIEVGEGLLRRHSSPLGQRGGLRQLHVQRRRPPCACKLWRQLRAARGSEGDV